METFNVYNQHLHGQLNYATLPVIQIFNNGYLFNLINNPNEINIGVLIKSKLIPKIRIYLKPFLN